MLQATSEASTKAHKRAQQAAVQKAEHAQHELGVAKRECERSAGDAEDRRVQLSVLVETVETLQAGTVGKLAHLAMFGTHSAVSGPEGATMLTAAALTAQSCCNDPQVLSRWTS